MQKVDRFLYQVKANENVTIQITPSVNLGNLYTAALDKKKLPKPANGIYAFAVTKPVGQIHFFGIEFGFLGAPAGAQYQLRINGDAANNAGPFTTRVVNGDPLLAKQYQFEVIQ
jgi:hypothetical protein